MSLSIQVLGSSSSGNCTLIWNGKGALLVDIGFSRKYVETLLAVHGIPLHTLTGVLITHVHGDHMKLRLLRSLIKKRVPLYCYESLIPPVTRRSGAARMTPRYIQSLPLCPFEIGPFSVEPFEVVHDSEGGCFGYRIEAGGRTITIATDLGTVDDAVRARFLDSDAIVLESNHDPEMLANDRRIPSYIRERIGRAHLSNEECGETLRHVLTNSKRKLRAFFPVHISTQRNTPEIAVANCTRILDECGFPDVVIHPAAPKEVTPVVVL